MNRSRRQFTAGAFGVWALKIARIPALLSFCRGGAAQSAPASLQPDRFQDALGLELRGAVPVDSPLIELSVPAVAEDGAIVPVTLKSRIPHTDRLVIFVEKNPFPLIAAFQLEDQSVPFVSLRIKMNESSAVVALARVGGQYYRTEHRVRVVRGGCG